ncbi:MAG: outer membrane beta-barrel protein [Tabrizicola sp.]
MRLVLAAVLGFAAGAVQAGGPVVVAAEPEVAAPAAAPAGWDWTGFYAGVSAVSGNFSDSFADYDTSGFGIQAGYLRDFGRVVIGGELSYSKGDYGSLVPAADWDATRLKLIGGYDAGRFLPYAFVGMTRYDVNQATPFSDTMANYGIGARLALGQGGKFVAGLEYLIEKKDNFDNNFNLDNKELALRLDYRF